MVYFKYSLFELPIPIATDPAYGGDLLCSDLMPDISLKFQAFSCNFEETS